jgi:tetratricopeptide (TPR) repeat protein
MNTRLGLASLIAAAVAAQAPTAVPELTPTHWGVVVDVPATAQVKVEADVVYANRGGRALSFDIYQPPGPAPREARPAVVFLNAIGDSGTERLKHWGSYRSWPRLVAAHGMIGVSMDADAADVQASLRSAFQFLADKGKEHGIDANRLGVYAASANVNGAGEYLLGKDASAGIHAAILCYGNPPAAALRRDLPVLFIVAESDAQRGDMGEQLGKLWQKVLEQRAPWTLAYGSTLPHAFDLFADTAASRAMVMQMLAFWKNQLSPPGPTGPASPERAILAAQYGNDVERTLELLDAYSKQNPKGAAEALVMRGGMLQRVSRFAEAATAFARAIELGTASPQAYAGLGMTRLGEQKHDEAERLFQRALELGGDQGMVLGQLALTQLYLGKNAAAVTNYEKAIAAGIPAWAQPPGLARYNLACGYARLGQKDKAILALEQAVDAGFRDKNQFTTDEDMNPLRAEPRFQALLQKLQ